MTRAASPSSASSNDIDLNLNTFLQQQRQRESSAGAFDHSKEDPVIVEINAGRLRDKLSQLKAGHLPSRLMTTDELYYMAKDPHLWPWQRTAVLTPTPPDTPISTSMEIEESSSHCVAKGENKEEADIQSQPRIVLASSHKQKRFSNLPQSKHARKKQSNPKQMSGGVRKEIPACKHSMITRSMVLHRQNTYTRVQGLQGQGGKS